MAKFFYVIGIITMVLSGSCSLRVLNDMDSRYVTYEAIAIIGGVPFAIGLVVFFLARRSLKNRAE